MKLSKNTILIGVILLVIFASSVSYYFLFSKLPFNFKDNVSKNKIVELETKETIQEKNKCLNENLIAVYENDKKEDVGKIKIIIRNDKDTDFIVSDFEITDVPKKNYHPIELHKCGIYVLKSFNFDYKSFKALPGFSSELWYYNYDGNGKQLLVLSEESETGVSDAGGVVGKLYLFNYSYDFRVDPLEHHIVLLKGYLGSPDYALVIKDLKTLEDAFVLLMTEIEKNKLEIVGDLGLEGWSQDSRYFWVDTQYGANELGFIRIDSQDWSYELLPAPENVLGGDALNLENGYITVHPGNVWYGVEEIEQEEKVKRRKEGIGTELYIHNLITGERKFVVKTDEPLYFFKPKWISDNELEYEMPSGEKKIYKLEK